MTKNLTRENNVNLLKWQCPILRTGVNSRGGERGGGAVDKATKENLS